MSTLYKITDEIRELQAMCDADVMSAEDIADTMAALSCEFDKKIEACLQVRQLELNKIINADAEIERLTKLKKAPQNNVEWLTSYVKHNMINNNLNKLEAGLFKLTIRKPMKKLGDVYEDLIPQKFFTEVPASRKLDKRALLAAAKISHIEGVEIIDSERSLTIK